MNALQEVLGLAIQEAVSANPRISEFMPRLVTDSVGVVQRREMRNKEILAANPRISDDFLRGREKIYSALFTTKGISEETSAKLIEQIIAQGK